MEELLQKVLWHFPDLFCVKKERNKEATLETYTDFLVAS